MTSTGPRLVRGRVPLQALSAYATAHGPADPLNAVACGVVQKCRRWDHLSIRTWRDIRSRCSAQLASARAGCSWGASTPVTSVTPSTVPVTFATACCATTESIACTRAALHSSAAPGGGTYLDITARQPHVTRSRARSAPGQIRDTVRKAATVRIAERLHPHAGALSRSIALAKCVGREEGWGERAFITRWKKSKY